MKLHDDMRNVKGTVLWYAKAAVDNVGNYGSMLQKVYWKYPALMPLMPHIDGKSPRKVKGLTLMAMNGDRVLFWTAPKGNDWKNKAEKYVVYRFEQGEKVNLNDPKHIVAITANEFYKLPKSESSGYNGRKAVYYVTAIDRMGNESKAKKKSIRY